MHMHMHMYMCMHMCMHMYMLCLKCESLLTAKRGDTRSLTPEAKVSQGFDSLYGTRTGGGKSSHMQGPCRRPWSSLPSAVNGSITPATNEASNPWSYIARAAKMIGHPGIAL